MRQKTERNPNGLNISTSDGKIDNLNLNGLFQRPSMAFAFNLSRLKAKMYMIFSLQKLSNPAEKNRFVSLVEVLLEQIYAVLTSHVTNDTVSIQIVYEDAMADKKTPSD